MSDRPGDSSAAPAAAARTIFDGYLEALDEGQEADFDGLVGSHPELAEELRGLRKSWQQRQDQLDGLFPGPLPADVDDGPDAATPPPRAPTEVGQQIDDFRLERCLGKGAMGEVWEAEQLSLRRRVALKLLRPGTSISADSRALLNEAHAAGRVDHDGIVSVYAAGVADGVPWIAQQLISKGRTLADLIEERLPGENSEAAYRRLAVMFVEITDAVEAAHEVGVLHRDIKPRNILIGRDGRARVGDFGLAYVAEDVGSAARPGLVGTYAYMSPEQCGGDEVAIDRRSDVFGLGAVLYEALTRRQAFPGDSAEAIVHGIRQETPPDPRTVRPGVPRDLALICAKALEKERRRRYQTMAELRDDLQRYLDHEPIKARPVGALALARKWSRRHPAQFMAVILGSVALFAVSVLLAREVDLRLDAENERDRADTAAAEAVDNLALAEQRTLELRRQSYLSSVLAAAMNLERGHHVEARRLLLSCDPEHRAWEWHHFMLRADTSLGLLSGHTGTVLAVDLSSDGRRAVTGSQDGTARVWSTGTRRSERMLGGHRSPVGAVALSADGTRVFTGAGDGTVRVWDAETGEQLDLLTGRASPVASLAVSADGHLLVTGSADGAVRTWDLELGGKGFTESLAGSGPALVDMDAEGSLLITSSRLGTVDVWYLPQFTPALRLTALIQETAVSAIGAQGTRALSGSVDGSLTFWNVDESSLVLLPELSEEELQAHYELFNLQAHAGRVSGVSLSADGNRGVSFSDEADQVLLWDLSTQRKLAALTGLDGHPTCVALSDDGSMVLVGSDDGSARLWDGETRDTVVPLEGVAAGPLGALAMSADGSLIAGATALERWVRLWDGQTGHELDSLGATRVAVGDIGLSADGARLVVAATDTSLLVWDGSASTPVAQRFAAPARRLGEGAGTVSALALSPAGRWLVTGSGDAVVRLWDLDSGEVVESFEGHGDSITAVAISSRGDRLASLGLDGLVLIWELGRTQPVAQHDTLSSYEDGTLAFDTAGGQLAIGRIRSAEIEVLDVPSGEVRIRLRGSGSGVMSLALTDSGRRLVAGFYGSNALWTWDVESGDMVAEIPTGGGSLWSLAPSADGRRMITGDQSGTVRVWESVPEAARALWNGASSGN